VSRLESIRPELTGNMKLTRYIKPSQIRLELGTRTPDPAPEGWSESRLIWTVKEQVLEELVELFESSGRVVNRSKLLTDLLNRERKATTGIGDGLAIPHVRTMQARDFVLVFARSTPGVEFGALDRGPVHLFLGIVAPPYHDKLYLQVYKQIAEIGKARAARETLMNLPDEHAVIKFLSDLDSWART
jgi:mannitol/fructose-specific phosphotransferase system IIA component (Ntr-type)